MNERCLSRNIKKAPYIKTPVQISTKLPITCSILLPRLVKYTTVGCIYGHTATRHNASDAPLNDLSQLTALVAVHLQHLISVTLLAFELVYQLIQFK
jgi:hypothetical protein